jgi:hypothetical protein
MGKRENPLTIRMPDSPRFRLEGMENCAGRRQRVAYQDSGNGQRITGRGGKPSQQFCACLLPTIRFCTVRAGNDP